VVLQYCYWWRGSWQLEKWSHRDCRPKVNDCFISRKYLIKTSSSFSAFVYDSAEKQIINKISFVIEQRKNEYDMIAEVRLCLTRVISLSWHLPVSIFSRWVDITSIQNLLISFDIHLAWLNITFFFHVDQSR
jgi:hypothetical protein